MKKNLKENETLLLIPKATEYTEYMIDVILKIPRTEKYSIGNEYKQSTYKMINMIIYLTKLPKAERLRQLNEIDCELNIQRILLRIMCKKHWIDKKKFEVAMDKLGEVGKILGGLIKYYGKDNKE